MIKLPPNLNVYLQTIKNNLVIRTLEWDQFTTDSDSAAMLITSDSQIPYFQALPILFNKTING